MSTPQWATEALEEAMRRVDGDVPRLAEATGIKKGTLYSWRKGAVPQVDNFDKLIQWLGGDMRHALPWHSPALAPATAEEISELRERVTAYETALRGVADAARIVGRPSARKSRKAG